MSGDDTTVEAVGWRVTVQPDAGEIRLEHEATGSVYVLEGDGGLRVPGGADAGVDPATVRAAIGEALASAETGPASTGRAGQRGRALPDGGQATGCTVECDDATGEVIIESDTKISLDAPVVDIAASGNMDVTSSGLLTLQGSIVKVN